MALVVSIATEKKDCNTYALTSVCQSVGSQLDFHYIDKILRYICVHVPEQKEDHAVLERH